MKNLFLTLFFANTLLSQQIDYSKLEHWIAHPLIKDYSDSVSSELVNIKPDGRVDVFYIYPTIYDNGYTFKNWNADIYNEELNNEVATRPILFQSTAFNVAGDIYSPKYRQAHLDAYDIENPTTKDSIFKFAYEDVKNAFQYYLDNWNNSRPILIAAHSQGSTHAKRLLKEFFESKPLSKKLVAAYIIGIAIEENYFTELSPCNDSNQINCFIGWRTYRTDFLTEKIKNEKFVSVVTNPLTWQTQNNSYGSFEQNKGAILLSFNNVKKNIIDAQIHDNVLWISRPKLWWSWFYPIRNYHIADINLFYVDIRMNVLNRINNYFLKN